MTLNRRNPKRDDNEAEIVKALSYVGVKTVALSGPGIPDLWCIYRGHSRMVEIKSRLGTLTPDQLVVHAAAALAGAPVDILRHVDEIPALLEKWNDE